MFRVWQGLRVRQRRAEARRGHIPADDDTTGGCGLYMVSTNLEYLENLE